MELLKKIKEKDISVSIVGLGYTGLALAVEIANSGIYVNGIDINIDKVKTANSGKSYISDIKDSEIEKIIKNDKFSAYSDYSPINRSDVILVCVPTPLNQNLEPDLTSINQALNNLRNYKLNNKLIILESTTYPGTTKEVALPTLNNGYRAGEHYFLAYSPERIDPGNNEFGLNNTTRVVGGFTENCGKVASEFFNLFVKDVHTVSSPEAAEMTKLFENTFRCVNIALVNEMMLMCDRMGMDVWEVINAASTKEFGYMPFQPGPGLGGHCIPIDPFYLSWKAKEYGFYSDFIELAGKRNASMPYYVVSKIADALNENGKSIKNAKFLIIGVAYKKDINDTRESPAFKIIELLKKKGGEVIYYDPFIEKIRLNGYRFKNAKLSDELLSDSDCTVIVTDHSSLDYKQIVERSKLVVDTRNKLKKFDNKNIVRI